MPEGPQVATGAPGLWYNPTDQDSIQQKPPLPCSARAIICLCQLGNSSPVLPCLHRPGLFRDSPTRALLWEAGVHPALGPPSGTVTIGAVFPLRLQAFPQIGLTRLEKQKAWLKIWQRECWCSCNTSSINRQQQGNLCFLCHWSFQLFLQEWNFTKVWFILYLIKLSKHKIRHTHTSLGPGAEND